MSGEAKQNSSAEILKNLISEAEGLLKSLESGGAAAEFAQGRAFELASMPVIAVEHYSKALALDPDSGDIRAALITALLKSRKADIALEHAIDHASNQPDHKLNTMIPGETVSAFSLLGDAYALNENLDAAENSYAASLEADKEDGYAAGRLATLALQQSSEKRSSNNDISHLAKLTQENPRFEQVRSISRMAEISPAVGNSISIEPLIESLGLMVPGRPFIVDGKRLRANVSVKK